MPDPIQRSPSSLPTPGVVPEQLDPSKAPVLNRTTITRTAQNSTPGPQIHPQGPQIHTPPGGGQQPPRTGPNIDPNMMITSNSPINPATGQVLSVEDQRVLSNPQNPAGAAPTFNFPSTMFRPITPQTTLRGQNVLPGQDPRLASTQGLVDQFVGSGFNSPEASRARQLAVQGLEGQQGPDRGQIASDVLSQLRESTEDQFRQDRRAVGQDAARFGRLGSGVTTSRLGDLADLREQDFTRAARGLASEAAGLTLADRQAVTGQALQAGSQFAGEDLSRFGAAQGAEAQQFGQGASVRNEIRGERDFENLLARLAVDDRVRQTVLSDDLLNSAVQRDNSRLGFLNAAGFGSDPTGILLDSADQRRNSADASGQTASQLLFLNALRNQGGT